jgi:twitching motility protein PilT
VESPATTFDDAATMPDDPLGSAAPVDDPYEVPAELPHELSTRVDSATGPQSVEPFLRALVELGGSDLHCKTGSPPRVRIDGRLRKLQAPTLTPVDTEYMASEVLRDDLVDEFARTNEADFAYSLPGVGRFRVNAFRARGSAGLVFRRVSVGAIELEDLGLPQVVNALSLEPRGLVLVTGPTGSGKTTTLAGMIDHINQNREVHVVTIEDPIEVLHYDKLSMINQREIRIDTTDFAIALRAAMRQDPDVILVGEMRDVETVKAALAAAETGHFVLSTLHTTDAAETVNRVIDFFPPHEQKQIRITLAESLRGILCQRLVPRSDGYGRCVAMEVLVNTGRVADAISDPEKTSTITQLIGEGSYYGMQTFDQHLVSLIRDGVITLEAAMMASSSPHDLTVELRRLGLVA